VTTFAQVSDLHFGRHDPRAAEALLLDLQTKRPTVVIVSGDLTQRAFAFEFRAARAWLDRLGLPWLAVPGNHDIPLYDFVRRFFSPLGRWRRYITAEDTPFFTDGQVAILGLNTARRSRWKEGRIGDEQVEAVRARFLPLRDEPLRVLVTHHPFLPAPEERRWSPMDRAEEALRALEDCHLDLLLSGHQHRAYSADVERHYEKVKRTLLTAHSGTSISTRTRGEPNTWNLFDWRAPDLVLEIRTLVGGAFETTGRRTFQRGAAGWRTLPSENGVRDDGGARLSPS
jgi:3',5'-cyclic AMP phosphodiesterase CpdA